MLDERSRTLLKTLIERYIADGQPVGSRALSKYSGLDLSAATVRNVMADLEDLGFIASPHTSAGRIPTPRGYRFFVDSLLTVQPLESEKIHAIEGRLHPSQPKELISNASHLLSGGVLLGAFYIATDYVTSPVSKQGQLVFGFGVGQAHLGVPQAVLDAGAQLGGLFAGLAGGGLEQFFGVGDHDLQVGNQFVFGECGVLSHGEPRYDGDKY